LSSISNISSVRDNKNDLSLISDVPERK